MNLNLSMILELRLMWSAQTDPISELQSFKVSITSGSTGQWNETQLFIQKQSVAFIFTLLLYAI